MNEEELKAFNYAKDLIKLFEVDPPLVFSSDDKEMIRILVGIIERLNSDTCIHCSKGEAKYCEDCYQKLIAKNAELQLNNDVLYKAEEKCGELYSALFNIIRKHIVASKGEKLGKTDKEISQMTIDTINVYLKKHNDIVFTMKCFDELAEDEEEDNVEDDGDHIPRIG